MPMTVYGDISPRVGVVAERKLLDRGQHLMLLERFGSFDPQGSNRGKSRKWRRYLSLARAVAPLAEGMTPAAQKMTFEDVLVTLEQYGDLVELTDVIADTHEDPVLDTCMTLCGEAAAETVEWLRFVVLRAGSNVFYSGTATIRTEVEEEVDLKDFRAVFRAMKKNKAKEISQIISATGKIATEPVGAAYFAVCHTDLMASLADIDGWTPVEKYASDTAALPGEVGKVENIRVLASAFYEPWLLAGETAAIGTVLANGIACTGANDADVYPILVFARDSYGIVPLQGRGAVTPIVQNPNTPRGGDPLGQRGSVGWKTYQATAILNQNWVARIEVAAKAL